MSLVWLFYFGAIVNISVLECAEVISLTSSNMKATIDSYDVVLVNFYADWCQHSRLLIPIFNNLAENVSIEFQNHSVAIAKVDCDVEKNLAEEHSVLKYPTIKLFKFGIPLRHEYRGQRNVEFFFTYLNTHLQPPFMRTALNMLKLEHEITPHIVGIFPKLDINDPLYLNFYKVASLVDECRFHAVDDNISDTLSVYFVKLFPEEDKVYCPVGILSNLSSLYAWSVRVCTPLVRVLTFSNAEEITEEGLPLVLLFHHPSDKATPKRFISAISQNHSERRSSFSFLLADGSEFFHPLLHLGKSLNDLPLICIDSFQHMYVFPASVWDAFDNPSLLNQFLDDLTSGKLHNQFHNGPDIQVPINANEHVPAERNDDQPLSVFQKLAPGANRYNFIHDEF